MIKLLLNSRLKLLILLMLFTVPVLAQTTTVFSDDFTTSRGTTYTTVNGPVGTSPTWTMLRSGTDFGSGINNGRMVLSNDASGSGNASGWVLAYTSTTAFASPYNATLNSSPGLVTWTFNMRQTRSNPSGPASGYYAPAFILAGSSGTTATAGTGYAVILGQSGSIDPVRLVRYTAGIRTSTNILTSNTSGLTDFGTNYLSIRVTFAPTTGTWQLFVRNDGTTAFQDPEVGTLTLQGSAVNTASTTSSLPLLGAYWNAGTRSSQMAYFDNVKVTVATPSITSISPTSRVANSGAFTLTVNGTNFTSGSTVRWNGTNRTTTFVSATQLTASILAADINTSGTAAITVATGTAVSNSQTFTIDPAGAPSISTSTNALAAMNTVTGTASASQSFTVNGANLLADVTVTAPANFEVSTNNTAFTDAVTLTRTGNVLVGQPVTVYTRVKASAAAGLYSGSSITLATSGGASKLVGVSATVLSVEPASSAANVTFTNVTSSTFTINWTGVGANHLVVLKQGSAVTATPADGTVYTAATLFGQGSDIGSASYAVYNSTGTSVTVTGLTPATAYYVAVYEFNGSGGTQNYRITSPATGNRTTINAPLGLQVTTANQAYNINFDTTVDGVNNSQFDGGGVSAAAGIGELSSNSWSFTGFSGGSLAFGGNSPEDSSYENGESTGGEVDGGLYAFEVSPNNFALGVQPATGEFAPGTITFRFQNQTGAAITSLSVGYKVYVYNDEAGSNSFNFSHSADNSTYTSLTALNETTTAAADAVPGWKAYYKVVTITGLNLASNSYYYLRWSGATASGSAFDEIALDDISIVANPTTTFAQFAGTAETFTVAGNANLTGAVAVNGNLTFLNSSWLAIGANTLTISGALTNTTTGGLRGSASSNLTVNGTAARTLSFDQTTAGTTNLLNNLSVATTGSVTTTLGNNLVINGALNVEPGQTLNLVTNTLTGTLGTITNDGTVTTQNTTSTPFASGKTWGGTGTLNLNAASTAQTLVAGTYHNVTVTTTGGAAATGNVTVNGALNLPNANPSATKGAFDTGTFSLILNPGATNTGTGDVSGIVTRNSIVANTSYTFGHPNTNILIPAIGTLPTSLSLKTVLGQAPAGKTDGILRTYDFIQTGAGTGGAATKAIIRAHYLDSELNGNTENRLVDWVVVVSPLSTIEQSRSNYSTVVNYVELSNVSLAFFQGTFGQRLLTLANSQNANATWNGSASTSWTTAANWTPNAVPSDATNVIIPNAATTPNVPTLNPTTTIGTLSIETGGILNSPAGGEFIITGTTGAWINKGTFNPSTGNVTFNGTGADATMAGVTTFNNLTIAGGTLLRALNNNTITLNGTLIKTGQLAVGAVHNTFNYAGTNQTIVNPDGNGAYHNLTISGTGAVVPTTLNVTGDLRTNAAVNFAGTTVNLNGVDVENQIIGGTVSPTFNNLTINKTNGNVNLTVAATVAGTLSFTTGLLDIDNFNLTLGSAAVAGTFSATTMIVADGTGVLRRPYTGTGSYFFPIGEMVSNTSYSPIAINITSGTFNNAYVAVNVVDATHPNNQSTGSYLTRYWNVTQTGITNAVATVTGTFIAGDAVGGASTLAAAQLNGTFNQATNPWVKFGVLGATTLTATGATLTSGQTSAFTGIALANVTVSIIGEGIFCQNDAVILTTEVSGGTGPYTYTWSGGLGSGSTATPSTAVAGTETYTLTITDANGQTASDTADISVSQAPFAGSLSADQTVCSGSTPAAVTLTGYSGTIVRWERSNTPAFGNPSAINNTTATLTPAQMGAITSTRYYRAVVQSGSCPVVYTDPVMISLSSTTWDGSSWSNGLPTASTAIIFTGNYTATGNIDACSIQVTNNAVVDIPSGNTVNLHGVITVTSGSFTLENNANLIQNTNVANSGNIIVKRNSSELFRQDYTMWSSPVNGVKTLQEFSPVTLSTRFMIYNSATNQFNATPATGTFTPGLGYLIRMPNGAYLADNTTLAGTINGTPGGYQQGTATMMFTGIFEGVPNNGNVVKALSNAGTGYNMIGNPYPSPISIPSFLTANSGSIEGTMWIWRKKNNANSPNSAYITVNSTGQYVGNGEPEAEDPNGILRTAQGFIVRRTGTANVTFTNAMRSANTSNQFFRMSNNNELPESHGIWLNLAGPNNAFSQMYSGYIAGATQGEDNGIDSRYINDGQIVLASLVNNTEMIIQGRSLPFAATDAVPLVLKTNVAGNYTITIDHVDGLFTGNQDIFIKDNLLGLTHNLKESAYAFATGTGTFTDRFEIVYMAETLGNVNPALSQDEVIVYKDGKTLHITSGKTIMDGVEIFDTRGRLIYTKKDINAVSVSIEDLIAEEQMLLININTERGKVSKKVIF